MPAPHADPRLTVTAAQPLLCGIDAGTSQVRALVFTVEGTVVASAAEPTPIRLLGPDSAELDPEALWASRARRAAAGRRPQVPDPRAIRSIAVASVGEAGVLLGDDGRPLAPIIAWYDTRTTGELDWLLSAIGFERLHRITGLCADPTFSLLKLHVAASAMRPRRSPPRGSGSTSATISPGACPASGPPTSASPRARSCSTWSSASGRRRCSRPPAFPARSCRRCWPAAPLLGRFRPEVAARDRPAGGLRRGRRWPRPCLRPARRRAPTAPGVLLDSLGTAEALSLVSEAPLADPALGWDGFNQGVIEVDRPLYYVFGGLPTAAAAVEWFRALYAGVDHATLIAEAEAAPAGSDGVLFLPHLRLGSPPFPDPIGRGAFLGLSAATSRGALFRALLEGIALDGGQHPEGDAAASGQRAHPSGSSRSAAARATSC